MSRPECDQTFRHEVVIAGDGLPSIVATCVEDPCRCEYYDEMRSALHLGLLLVTKEDHMPLRRWRNELTEDLLERLDRMGWQLAKKEVS